MSKHLSSSGRTTSTGLRRGTFQWCVNNFINLKPEEVESCPFDIGGFTWKIGLRVAFRKPDPRKFLRVFLISSNPQAVSADVQLGIVNSAATKTIKFERTLKTALPYHIIDRHDIPLDQLSQEEDGNDLKDELILTVDLKNVEKAGLEQLENGNDSGTVKLEIIRSGSIKSWLNASKAFGLASAERIWDRDVCKCSLISSWSGSSNHRYWLCKRSIDGNLIVKKSLNDARLLESFGDICEEDDNGCLWVTLFKEDKDNQNSLTVGDDSIVVFCKLFEPPYEDLTYLGHLIVSQTMVSYELLTKVSDTLANFSDNTEYRAYLELGDFRIRDITFMVTCLAECGFHSGSSIILISGSDEIDNSERSVQLMLRAFHVEEFQSTNEDAPELVDVQETKTKLNPGEAPVPRIDGQTDPDVESSAPSPCTDCSTNSIQDSRRVEIVEEDLSVTKPSEIKSNQHHEAAGIEQSDVSVNSDDANDPLKILSDLTPGSLVFKRFLVGPERICGKPHVLFAVDKMGNNQRVVLKFYASRGTFEKSKKLHQKLSSDYVCKLLHVVDNEDGFPPCLVFERGDDSLDQWMQRTRPDPVTQKCVLFQILNCISYLHSQNIIHCDIKPANIMFFVGKHKWKLLDMDTSVEKGKPSAIQYSPMYASPEVIRAEQRKQTSIVFGTSTDMWSFGVLAFEVLTGNRLYGPSATADTVKDLLLRRLKLPSLESVTEEQARRWLEGMLRLEPNLRWSAQRALAHAVFKTAEDTIQRSAGINQLVNAVDDIRTTVTATYREISKANLLANIELENLGNQDNGSLALRDTECPKALTIANEYKKDEPIFLLTRGKGHRLRVNLAHKHQSNAANFKIKYISAKPTDGIELGLRTVETKQPAEGSEVIALFPTDAFQSIRLSSSCPQFGTMEEKYVEVSVTIGIDAAANESGMENLIEMKGRIWCLPVSRHNPFVTAKKFMRFACKEWEKAPKWMRDSARGAIISTAICLKTTAYAEPTAGQPVFWWHFFNSVMKCFVLPCFRLQNT